MRKVIFQGLRAAVFLLTAVVAAVIVAYYASTQRFHIDDSDTRLPSGASFEASR